MDLRLSVLTLATVDLDRSARFYREVFGLPELASVPNRPLFLVGPVTLALRLRDALLDETGVKGGRTVRPRDVFPGFTLTHQVESEEAVDQTLAEVAARGGRVVRFPEHAAGLRYAGLVADPDGFLWELVHDPALWLL